MVKYKIVNNKNATTGFCLGLECIKYISKSNDVKILTADDNDGLVYTNKKPGILHNTRNKIKYLNSWIFKTWINYFCVNLTIAPNL